ncbi:Fluconazole resistance protein 1 [Fusarium falciforme]
MPNFPAWTMAAKPQPSDLTMHFLQQPSVMDNMSLLYQGLVGSESGSNNTHVLSCPCLEVMMGMGDLMIYSGYDGEPMQL